MPLLSVTSLSFPVCKSLPAVPCVETTPCMTAPREYSMSKQQLEGF